MTPPKQHHKPSQSRRQFLQSVSIFTTGLAFSGLHTIFCRRAWAQKAGTHFPETHCGINAQAKKRVLIAYASMHGSTGEVADAIAGDLCRANASVDVRLVENVQDLSAYQAVMHYKMWVKGIEAGDYRNWITIHGFAGQLKSKILPAS
jgi:hypothetical protein